ncbi:MAG: L-threonylcarbamoyladenylate synthase [Verrucomicrobiota bacterium]|jgi:L-threonylcarbamoyladenylate synthase|nr:L-threonylcarbamoyladenylate synthase [Verrucomicrobiota bacterium]
MKIAPPTPENIAHAAELLNHGELVIVPTETVYGVAARADSAQAMERLYAAKGRAASKRIAFLVANLDAARTVGVRVCLGAERIAKRFWPGPLTMVLQHGNGDWDGFRVPEHPVALAWLGLLDGLPAVTSANRSGMSPAHTAREAMDALAPHVCFALDAGPAEGRPSTVIKVHVDRIELLREGPIPLAAIQAAACGAPIRPGP